MDFMTRVLNILKLNIVSHAASELRKARIPFITLLLSLKFRSQRLLLGSYKRVKIFNNQLITYYNVII